MSLFETCVRYLYLGLTHVIPLGFDHILFIICIYLMGRNLKQVIIMCSIFTLAHSTSLVLAATDLIDIDTAITEPLIAFSIFITAIQNIVSEKMHGWKMPVIFIFGLIHGLGFAGALKETGPAGTHFIASLLFFNIGVESGQLIVIIALYVILRKWSAEKVGYKEKVVYPVSAMSACVALYWMIERSFA